MGSPELNNNPNKLNVSLVGELEQLPWSHIDEAARMAAHAFVHSASFGYIFEELEEGQRLIALTWLFTQTIKLRFHTKSPRCSFYRQTGKKPEIVCFFMIQPPNVSGVSAWDMIKHGMLLFPFKFGWQSFMRLLELMEYHGKDEASFFESRKAANDKTQFCNLERMAVKPAFQGYGVGTKALKTALMEVEAKGWGVLLSTQEDINVKFYSKLGFEVIHRKNDYFNTKAREGNASTTMAKGLNLASTSTSRMGNYEDDDTYILPQIVSKREIDTSEVSNLCYFKYASVSIAAISCAAFIISKRSLFKL